MKREKAFLWILMLSLLAIAQGSTAVAAQSPAGNMVFSGGSISLVTAGASNQTATMLSVSVQPAEVRVGSNVTLLVTLVEQPSGQAVGNASVALSLTSTEAGVSKSLSIRTGMTGNFSYSQLIDKAGNYTVRASYAGDAFHQPAIDSFAYFKARIGMKLDLHTSTIEVSHDLIFGSTVVNLTGSTTPPLPNATIRIDISGTAPQYVVTGANGTFSYAFTPPAEGDYRVSAHYDGDNQHSPATSSSTTISVHANWTTLIVVLVVIAAVLGLMYLRGIARKGVAPIGPPPGVVCPSCGSRSRAGATFCKRCGASLRVATGTLCPRCRTSNKPAAAFCRKCGAQLR